MDYRETIQQSMDEIEANLKTMITAEELAGQAGFSLFHYYRLFQSATGLPVMQYVLRRRLLHAIYEIHQGRTRIDVVLEYGFDTYAGFYKAFIREFGCTPSNYLESNRVRQPYRLNLKKEEHMILTRKKMMDVLKHWNLENEPIIDIYYESSGNKNDNAVYVGENSILKFTANLGKLKKHIELSAAIEQIGLSAATPIKTADGREYVQDGELYFYLTKRISGASMLAESLYEGDFAGKARFIGEIIGQLHLALNKVDAVVDDVDLQQKISGWALPKVKELMPELNGFWSEYRKSFDQLYDLLPRQIIHRDPNPGNIILAEEKWGFIDFDLSERNVRIYDPCYAATAILSESFVGNDNTKLERWLDIYKNILLGYDSVVKLTNEERKAIPYVLISNQLVCVAWFSTQEKYAKIYETNKAMTRWLVGKFKQLQMD